MPGTREAALKMTGTRLAAPTPTEREAGGGKRRPGRQDGQQLADDDDRGAAEHGRRVRPEAGDHRVAGQPEDGHGDREGGKSGAGPGDAGLLDGGRGTARSSR